MRLIPYNEKAFTPKEVEAGMVTEFIDFLLKQDAKTAELRTKNHKYTNINIKHDGYCTIVQYCEVFFDEDDPCFEFVDEGEHVATVLVLPDNTTVLCWDQEDADETLKDFLKNHPYYVQNEYGRWYDTRESKQWEELMNQYEKTDTFEDPDINIDTNSSKEI